MLKSNLTYKILVHKQEIQIFYMNSLLANLKLKNFKGCYRCSKKMYNYLVLINYLQNFGYLD